MIHGLTSKRDWGLTSCDPMLRFGMDKYIPSSWIIRYVGNRKIMGHKTRWDTDLGLLPQKFGLKYAPDYNNGLRILLSFGILLSILSID